MLMRSSVLALAIVCAAPTLVEAGPSLAAKTYYDEGLRLMESNRNPEAIKALRRAVAFSTDYVEAWMALGQAQLATGDYDSAAKAFKGALLAKPGYGDAQYNLGYALERGGKLESAAEAYRVFLQSSPRDPDGYYRLAETLEAAGDKRAAAEAYDRYAALENRTGHEQYAANARRKAALLIGKTPPPVAAAPAARPTTTAAATPAAAAPTASQPAAVAAHDPLAAPTADPLGSNATAQSLAASFKTRPPAFDLGLKALRAGDFTAALAQLTRAAQAAPDDSIVLAGLGSAHLGSGNAIAATEAYRLALKRASAAARPGIQLGLAESLRIRESDDEAATMYRSIRDNADAPDNLKQIARERLALLN